MTYAFTFDASACTGCKACQMACKDKNNLPPGVLWRRVFEVCGGSWQQQGEAWTNDVFAYNLSIACNHCVHPKCAGVCPTNAYVQREDGIVYIDESKCMGCGYCNWACPYSVPQYNPELGRMTKCNFCLDELAQGKPPACVAACPMRVLNYTVVSEQLSVSSEQLSVIGEEYQELWQVPAMEHPFPLPAFSRTQPHLAIKPHPAMGNDLEKAIANREETRPRRETGREELPLVAFTLLTQMAGGMAVTAGFFQPSTFYLLTIGFLLALGGLISFLHLGTKKNAWRAVFHLKKSWLSREILAFGLFGLAWLTWLLAHGLLTYSTFHFTFYALTFYALRITALLGFVTIYAMARVYHLRAISGWNTWRTEAAFFLAAGTLGTLATALLTGRPSFLLAAIPFLAGEAALILSARKKAHETASRLRLGLIAAAAIGAWMVAQGAESARVWTTFPIFLPAAFQEVLGRLAFYALRHDKQKLP
ncbi:MAG: hypothetical protein Fur0043_11630 [Anaerolineales bacterium]